MMNSVAGVIMEIEDCSFPQVVEISQTSLPDEAFKDADVCILVGSMPRREGMLRKDLLKANAQIFKIQGTSLDRVAKKSVKVLVVGNPANTNALITSTYAPSIPPSQFASLTQLDQNRAKAQIARRLRLLPQQIKNIIIWGNHSATQYPSVQHAYVVHEDGSRVSVREAVSDDAWLKGEFVRTVQTRGAAVIHARKLSSAMSAAKAIGDHMRLWWKGTLEGEYTSMGVLSDGSYGLPRGVMYSHPVTIKDGKISIVQGLDIDDFSRQMMDKTADELLEERDLALSLVTASL